VTVSEGAMVIGGEIIEQGEADAYGHRKLGGIGEIIAEQVKKITSQHILYQKFAYVLRAGAPDSLDRMVAMSYGNLAMQLVLREEFGKLVALQGGRYTTVPIEIVMSGKKQVDVEAYYDRENYKPKVKDFLGVPMFLT